MLVGIADTHALVWFATRNSRKIGASARKIFEAADRKDGSGFVTVPTVVLHEISSLLIGERIEMATGLSDLVRLLETHGFFKIVDVTAEMVLRSHNFKAISDPFDRLILGCADLLQQPLMTVDDKITKSGLVQVVWE
jgi:PIN domain nuclease of toxin-antitoxin system